MHSFVTAVIASLVALPAWQQPAWADYGPGKAEQANLYVLAIGINQYPGKEKLEEAVKDAKQIAESFRAHASGIFRHVETKVLTDQQANREGILQGLAWLRKSAQARDLAVIYYSGHGGVDKKHGFFLWPYGGKDNHFAKTALFGHELKAAAGQLHSKCLVLLDACEAGAISKAQPEARNVVFFCPCRGHEDDLEKKNWHHSLLAKVVLDGVAGKADVNKDGTVTLEELEHYVMKQVKELSKDKQHPVIVHPRDFPTLQLAKAG
ncbi:MAG TPA: caspase family protein [Gemmataceae bacterium]|nr:caspase family protein [Gemmataceae bacterium]